MVTDDIVVYVASLHRSERSFRGEGYQVLRIYLKPGDEYAAAYANRPHPIILPKTPSRIVHPVYFSSNQSYFDVVVSSPSH